MVTTSIIVPTVIAESAILKAGQWKSSPVKIKEVYHHLKSDTVYKIPNCASDYHGNRDKNKIIPFLDFYVHIKRIANAITETPIKIVSLSVSVILPKRPKAAPGCKYRLY